MKRFPKKYSKLLFSIIASLVLAFTMCGTTTQLVYADDLDAGDGEEAHVHDGNTFEAWKSDDSLPYVKGQEYYYLTKDVTLAGSGGWDFLSGGEVHLCLNGHSITAAADNDSCITVSSGMLKLYDCGEKAGTITNTGNNSCGVKLASDGTFEMHGGTISGNHSSGDGGGVNIAGNGTFKMYGGTISGNGAEDDGGGVYVYNGTFEMHDGTISGNGAGDDGGGVYIEGGSFKMIDGTISENNAGDNGGGVCTSVVIPKISGGTITDNTADGDGGGVFIIGGGKIQLSGSPQITGNTVNSKANNIFLGGGAKAEITDTLRPTDASGPQTGVTMYESDVFTSGLSNNLNPETKASDIFFSDDPVYYVTETADGEARLAERIDFASENVTLSFDDVTYTAKETDPVTMTLKFSETDTRELKLGTDYKITNYKDDGADMGASKPKYAGTYTATVKGIGAYKGEATVNFTIEPAPLTITAKDQTLIYNGEIQGPEDAAYENAEEIAKMVTVDGLQGTDALTKVDVDGQGGPEVGVYQNALVPGSATINGGAATDSYSITYVKGNLTITETKPEPTPAPSVDKKAAKIGLDAGVKGTSSGGKITAKWGRVAGASGYEVYAAFCGNKYQKIKDVGSGTTQIDITQIGGKKIGQKNAKYYVVAYQMVNGKKVQLAKSINAHIVDAKNAKYTNPKSIKAKKKYTLKKGKKAKIKAKLVLQKKGKKIVKHEAKFRYATSNPKVATVSKKGKIKAVGKGNCTVYVYAVNGCAKAIKVKVK